jgi:predicted transcriptional regulator
MESCTRCGLQKPTRLSESIGGVATRRKRLEALAKRAQRSKSFLAAEAIAAFVEAESWQLDEIQPASRNSAKGRGVPHNDVADWLRLWGREREQLRANRQSRFTYRLVTLSKSHRGLAFLAAILGKAAPHVVRLFELPGMVAAHVPPICPGDRSRSMPVVFPRVPP